MKQFSKAKLEYCRCHAIVGWLVIGVIVLIGVVLAIAVAHL
jgi:hypothetical protein